MVVCLSERISHRGHREHRERKIGFALYLPLSRVLAGEVGRGREKCKMQSAQCKIEEHQLLHFAFFTSLRPLPASPGVPGEGQDGANRKQ
jgi:hypothetical protein